MTKMKCPKCGEWIMDPILFRPVKCLCESEEEEEIEDKEDETD